MRPWEVMFHGPTGSHTVRHFRTWIGAWLYVVACIDRRLEVRRTVQ